MPHNDQRVCNDFVPRVQHDHVAYHHLRVGHQHLCALPDHLDVVLVLGCIQLLELQILLVVVPGSCARMIYV